MLILPTEQADVYLREWVTSEDDQAFFEAVDENREHLGQYGDLTGSKYQSVEDVRDRRLAATIELRMGIWYDGQAKGGLTATPEPDTSEIEIGYWLRYSAQKHGYATLAVKTLTMYIRPKYDRVFAEVHVDNIKSAAVMRRAGYTAVGQVVRGWGPAIVFEPTIST